MFNPFWKDVLKSWKLYCEAFEAKELDGVLFLPVWYNSNISNDLSFLIKISTIKVFRIS